MRLTQDQIKDIEAKAKDVLTGYFGESDPDFPIPVEDIAQSFGLDILYGNFPDDAISGVFKRGDGEGKIYIAFNEPRYRQNFTIAHELGHFLLHPLPEEVLYRRDTLNITDEQREIEAEANWFAAALLIPEEDLRKYWLVTQDTQLLADYFGVSPLAVRLRLKNLGLQ